MTEGLTQLTQPLWVAELLRRAAQQLWQGAPLAVLLALLLRLVPDSRSRLRYRAALTALVCLPLLFVLNLVIPNALPAPMLEVGAVTRGEAGGVAEGLQRSSQAALEQLPPFLTPAVRFVTSWAGFVAAYLLAVAALSSRLAAQQLYLRRLRRTALPGDAALQARVRARRPERFARRFVFGAAAGVFGARRHRDGDGLARPADPYYLHLSRSS